MRGRPRRAAGAPPATGPGHLCRGPRKPLAWAGHRSGVSARRHGRRSGAPVRRSFWRGPPVRPAGPGCAGPPVRPTGTACRSVAPARPGSTPAGFDAGARASAGGRTALGAFGLSEDPATVTGLGRGDRARPSRVPSAAIARTRPCAPYGDRAENASDFAGPHRAVGDRTGDRGGSSWFRTGGRRRPAPRGSGRGAEARMWGFRIVLGLVLLALAGLAAGLGVMVGDGGPVVALVLWIAAVLLAGKARVVFVGGGGPSRGVPQGPPPPVPGMPGAPGNAPQPQCPPGPGAPASTPQPRHPPALSPFLPPTRRSRLHRRLHLEHCPRREPGNRWRRGRGRRRGRRRRRVTSDRLDRENPKSDRRLPISGHMPHGSGGTRDGRAVLRAECFSSRWSVFRGRS